MRELIGIIMGNLPKPTQTVRCKMQRTVKV